MKIAIVSNMREKKGLYRDALILERLLDQWGHEVHCFDFRAVDRRDHSFTAVLHLEIVTPKALHWSDRQFWFVNPDWAKREYLDYAPAFTAVLAKSQVGADLMRKAKVPRVEFVGFESEDRRDPFVPRERRFFHTWGQSMVKGTRTVTRAWGYGSLASRPVSWFIGEPAKEVDFWREQNRCLFWLQPSAVEGYGHIIHEGLSCGALVATLNAPPMNESIGIAARIPCFRVAKQFLADVWEARPEAVAKVAEELWNLSDAEVNRLSEAARIAFEEERSSFRHAFRRVLEGS